MLRPFRYHKEIPIEYRDEIRNMLAKRGVVTGTEVEEFQVEAMLNRANDKIMNLIDRTNQMMTRNLKALQDFKRRNLTIRTDQINIAQNQVNQVVKKSRKRSSRGSSQGPSGDLPSDQ